MMPRKNDRFVAIGVVVLLVMAVSGCGTREGAPPAKTAGTAAGAKPPVQKKSSSVSAPPLLERFNFAGKKDPFRSYAATSKAQLPLPSISEKRLPIHKYEVNQFKVIGIIIGQLENRAMVLDPAGMSYVVKDGAMIGPHNGRVQKITPGAIEVTEQYREDSGRIRTRVVKLALPKKE